MPTLEVIELGRMGYEEALLVQEKHFNELLGKKRTKEPIDTHYFLLVEHDPVYTLGKSGDLANLRQKPEDVGASFFRTSRGGDITYHGPGQIVGYPILDLEQLHMGIAKYIWTLEECIIQTIAGYGLRGGRIEEASGVWLDGNNAKARKICAIGVKASRFVTMHGFAFNVNTALSYFGHIIPCGIEDKGVTSMQKELGRELDFEEVKGKLTANFRRLFGKA